MKIITEEDYKQFAMLKKTDIASNITWLVPVVNAAITSLLGFSNEESQQDVLSTSPNRNKYYIASNTIKSLDKVILDGIELASTEYTEYLRSGFIVLNNLPPKQGILVLEYTDTGFENIPEELKLAGCLLVDYYAKQDYKASVGFGSESITFNSTKGGIPEHIRMLISLHRRL